MTSARLAAAVVALTLSWPALGQQKPSIEMPSMIVAEPAGETALTIRVGPPETLPPASFIRIRGLPIAVSLNEGHVVAQGVWAVPLFALANLKVDVPAGVSGRSELTVSLVTPAGTTIAEARGAMVIANLAFRSKREPPRAETTLAPIAPPVPAGRPDRNNRTKPADLETSLVPSTPEPAKPARVSLAHFETTIADGVKALEQGRIAVARQFFRRAADGGHPVAALRLAETYDPLELARLPVRGLSGDADTARHWYRRALDLGEPTAEARLSRLDGR